MMQRVSSLTGGTTVPKWIVWLNYRSLGVSCLILPFGKNPSCRSHAATPRPLLLRCGCVACVASATMNREKLMKMASAVRTGGKGSIRRKKKAVHKTTTTDDKRLQSTLKRLGVNAIPGIEEVNIFKDETVIHFVNPKVQASIAANTWVVSGPSQTKKLEELLPSIINQLGADNLVNLKKIAQQYQRQEAAGAIEEEDDDVPELVEGENFEDASKEESETA